MAVYTPPSHDAIDFELTAYTAPSHDAIDFDLTGSTSFDTSPITASYTMSDALMTGVDIPLTTMPITASYGMSTATFGPVGGTIFCRRSLSQRTGSRQAMGCL